MPFHVDSRCEGFFQLSEIRITQSTVSARSQINADQKMGWDSYRMQRRLCKIVLFPCFYCRDWCSRLCASLKTVVRYLHFAENHQQPHFDTITKRNTTVLDAIEYVMITVLKGNKYSSCVRLSSHFIKRHNINSNMTHLERNMFPLPNFSESRVLSQWLSQSHPKPTLFGSRDQRHEKRHEEGQEDWVRW